MCFCCGISIFSFFFFSSRRRHTRSLRDWSSDVCSSEVIHALPDAEPSRELAEAHERVGPDTIVKFLFTSGSTGTPKAVINTQRMWCANQAMVDRVFPFFREEPPVLVDWAPWHHTAAG